MLLDLSYFSMKVWSYGRPLAFPDADVSLLVGCRAHRTRGVVVVGAGRKGLKSSAHPAKSEVTLASGKAGSQ